MYSRTMDYVALLRGINVGGKNKIEMTRLKTSFLAAGCVDVSTYINSGNVIFSDSRSPSQIISILESAIETDFGFRVPTILRTATEIREVCQQIPMEWSNDSEQKTDVLFLWDAVDEARVVEQLSIKPEIETVRYFPGVLVWNVRRENVTRSSIPKLVKSDLYKSVTIRNINTVRKIDAVMQGRQTVA